MNKCKYYDLHLDNGTYNTILGIECPKQQCTIDTNGLCELVQQEKWREERGLKIVGLYKMLEK